MRIPRKPTPIHYCRNPACLLPIPRHELDTDRTYRNRELCSRACDRTMKGTQSERARMRWSPEREIA